MTQDIRTEPAARRPGGRSARVRGAVLDTTLRELAEVGYAALSLEAIAQRAGVNKTTLYRRWGSREGLVLNAMLERGQREVPIPDTGSLRGDLAAYATEIVVASRTPVVEATIRTVASVGDREPRIADASRGFWRTRFEFAGEVVRRAIARGEVPPDTDPNLVVETVVASVYFRLLLSGDELDDGYVDRLAAFVAAGASAAGGAQR